jgi:hypothetical protein
MSCLAVPDDVHHIIIPYLPFSDILSYQQCCTAWWSFAAEYTTRIIFEEEYRTKRLWKTTELFKVIARRFPNIVELNFNDNQLNRVTTLECFKHCSDLQLIKVNQDQVMVSSGRATTFANWRQNILSRFPKYRAIALTYPEGNADLEDSKQNIQETLATCEITHAVISERNCDKSVLRTITRCIGANLTHLNISTHEIESILPEFLKAMPDETNLTHLVVEGGYRKSGNVCSVLKRSPHLTHFIITCLSAEEAKTLAECCPKLFYLDAKHVANYLTSITSIVTVQCLNLRELYLGRLICELPDGIVPLHVLQVMKYSNFVKNSVPHLKHVRKLLVDIKIADIDIVIENCKELEEIEVSSISDEELNKLMSGCPKLRYIRRKGYSIMDVSEYRDEQRPTKRARLDDTNLENLFTL